MTYRPAGTLAVLRLLALASLRRLLRATKVQQQKKARAAATAAPVGGAVRRTATTKKRGDGLVWLMVLMMPLWLYQGLVLAGGAALRMHDAAEARAEEGPLLVVRQEIAFAMTKDTTEQSLRDVLDQLQIDEHSHPPASRILEQWRREGREGFRRIDDDPALGLVGGLQWDGPESRRVFVGVGALLLFALQLLLIASGLTVANAALAGNGWQQAWLMTFPVSTRSLQLSHALSYSLVQFFPWFTYLPLSWQLLSALDVPFALPLALLGTALAAVTAGSLRMLLETWLRLTFSLQVVKTVQALCSIVVFALMALVFSVAMGRRVPGGMMDLADALPDLSVLLLPGSWPAAIERHGWLASLVGVALAGASLWGSVAISSRLLRHGVMHSGGVDSGRRGGSVWRRATRRIGVVGKDLLLLKRDRNFLTQTMIAPVFAVGLQVLINPGLDMDGARMLTLLSFFLGMSGASAGCFLLLGGEGRALWMLYSLPITIERALAAKVRIWATVGVAYGSLALLGFRLRNFDGDVLGLVLDEALLVFGVWCSAWIAGSVAVIGANAQADHVARGMKVRHAYLYLFFASTFLGVLATPSLGFRLGGAFAYGTLAFAFWQRARDRLRWLLDPVTEPQDQLRLFDGGGALVVFFVVQVLVLLLMRRSGWQEPAPEQVLIAFTIGGAVAVGFYALVLHGRGVQVGRALRLVGERGRLGWCLLGVVAGAALGAIALGYLQLVRQNGWFEVPAVEDAWLPVLLLLAVVMAPLFEELLFRGLIFGGLLRSVPAWLAVPWSALLFALVHPMASWPPVFLVGLACAWLTLRSGFLPAAMCLHATYNLLVVVLQ